MEQPEGDATSINRMSLRRRTKDQSNDTKKDTYLDSYYPEEPNREKRKLKRRMPTTNARNAPYDECGKIRHNGFDICDCMQSDCPGCWHECENCGSTRCGPNCRVNRRYYYETITYDGKDNTIINKHFPRK